MLYSPRKRQSQLCHIHIADLGFCWHGKIPFYISISLPRLRCRCPLVLALFNSLPHGENLNTAISPHSIVIWRTLSVCSFAFISACLQGIMLVYSTIEARSFKYVEYWLQNIPSLPVIIVGNKSDMQSPSLKGNCLGFVKTSHANDAPPSTLIHMQCGYRSQKHG